MPSTPHLTPRSAAVAVRDSASSSSATSSSTPLASKALIPLRPGEISLRRQKILTEREYTSSVSDIIKRDFFPNLDRLRAENDYLSALEDGDALQISRALKALIAIEDREKGGAAPASAAGTPRGAGARLNSQTPRTPAETPRHGGRNQADPGETPLRGSRDASGWDDTPALRSVRGGGSTAYSRYPDTRYTEEASEIDEEETSGFTPDLSMSLDAFQSAYTSEDNASFSQILDRANELRKEKYAWAYAAERAANERKRKALTDSQADAEHGKKLAIAAAAEEPTKLIGSEEQLLMIEDGSVDRAFSGEAEADKTSEAADPAPSASTGASIKAPERTDAPLASWRFKTRNALMFSPDADLSTSRSRNSSLFPTATSSSAPSRSMFQEALDSASTARPSVNYRSTDFAAFDEGSREDGASDVPGSPSGSRIDAAIRGSIAPSSVTGETSADPSSTASDTPRVAGYGFVSPYQTPVPDTPLGVGERIPKLRGLSGALRLDGDDGSSASQSFVLPPTRRREEVAHRLAESASRSLTTRASASSIATPSTTLRAGEATPYGVAKYTAPGAGGGGGLRSVRSSKSKKSKKELTPAARRLLASSAAREAAATANSPWSTSSLGHSLLVKRGSAGTSSADRAAAREEAARMDRYRQQRWEPTPSPVPHRSKQQ